MEELAILLGITGTLLRTLQPKVLENLIKNKFCELACTGSVEELRRLIAAGAGLIAAGAGVNVANREGTTPLHFASREGHVAVVDTLIAAGAGVNVANREGTTPLHFASREGHVAVVNSLIAAGADIDAANDLIGCTPIYFAVKNNRIEIVKALIRSDADVNAIYSDGISYLHIAAQNGNLAIVDALIKAEADADAFDNNGLSPLDIAVQKGYSEIARVLSKTIVDVGDVYENDLTYLHLAAQRGQLGVVNALISAGADVNVIANGTTPTNIAAINLQEIRADYDSATIANDINLSTLEQNINFLNELEEDAHEEIGQAEQNIIRAQNALAKTKQRLCEAEKNLNRVAQKNYITIILALVSAGAKIDDLALRMVSLEGVYLIIEIIKDRPELITPKLLQSKLSHFGVQVTADGRLTEGFTLMNVFANQLAYNDQETEEGTQEYNRTFKLMRLLTENGGDFKLKWDSVLQVASQGGGDDPQMLGLAIAYCEDLYPSGIITENFIDSALETNQGKLLCLFTAMLRGETRPEPRTAAADFLRANLDLIFNQTLRWSSEERLTEDERALLPRIDKALLTSLINKTKSTDVSEASAAGRTGPASEDIVLANKILGRMLASTPSPSLEVAAAATTSARANGGAGAA